MNKPLFPEIRVNGDVIKQSAIAAEAQNHKAPAGKPGVAWQAAARALVVRHLLLADAQAKGLKTEPARLAEDLMEADDEAIIRGYLDENLSPMLVQDDEVVKMFHRHDPDGKMNSETGDAIRRNLEQRNWTLAANAVVTQLVEQADISGIKMG